MDPSRRARTPQFAPLVGLVLTGVAITAAIYARPDALFGIALAVIVLCAGLIVAALVARRWRARNEAPSRKRVTRWAAAAAGRPAPDRVRVLLERLGEWPHLLDELPADLRDGVARAVRMARVTVSLVQWTGADQPPERRIGALHLLGWLRLSVAEGRLRAVMRDPDVEVALAAAEALMRVGTESAYQIVLEGIGDGPLPGSRLAALLEGADAARLLPTLQAHAADPVTERRFWVAHLAGRAGDPEAIPLLLELTTDVDLGVRANAAEGLGHLGAASTRERLHALLGDPSWVVQAHAARALGELGPGPSVEALVGLLASAHWWVRENAVRALLRASRGAIPELRPFLHRLDGDARRSLVDVLLGLGLLDAPDEAGLAGDLRAIEAVGAGAAIPDALRVRFGLPPLGPEARAPGGSDAPGRGATIGAAVGTPVGPPMGGGWVDG